MSDSTLPPEQWRPLFDKIGVEFGYRPLANRIGMEHTKLRRLLLGGGTSAATVRQVADAFGVSPEKVRELRSEPAETVVEPFMLPDDAGRLNYSERKVILSVVRALLDAKDNRHGTEDQKNLVHATDVDAGSDPEGQAADDARPNVWRDNPTDLSERRSRREALPEESPEDAIAARTRDPRFAPDDPAGYYGTNDIGEENQDARGWGEESQETTDE